MASCAVLAACSSKDDGALGVGGGAAAGSAGAAAGAGGSAPSSGGAPGSGTGGTGAPAGGGTAGSGETPASGGAPTAGGGGTSGSGFGGGARGGAPGGAGRGSGTAGLGSGNAGTAGSGGAPGGSAGAPDTSDHSPTATCARWNADRADMGEGTWSGSVDTCDPGDISADGRANALKIVNLYRWLADLPTVTTSDDRNAEAQACALIMQANGMLSHDPPTDWKCWTQTGHDGASQSNISSGPGVSSIDLYMVDGGNEDTLGHRRWVMSNSLGPIGLGSTGAMGASCMQNLTGTGMAGKAWQAWPPPGAFPIQAVKPGRFGGSLDSTGWSIQSDKIKLDAATVTVTSGGSSLPVTLTMLPGGYGSNYALSIVPSGWQTTAGQTYSVSVAGTSTPISYDVNVVDCAE
ncbi:MAG TPA: hypothetical protein VMI54_00470 [Polyangiaceae bacterium]|nr:hypothetical protein [Polyangiaceae bacterium]